MDSNSETANIARDPKAEYLWGLMAVRDMVEQGIFFKCNNEAEQGKPSEEYTKGMMDGAESLNRMVKQVFRRVMNNQSPAVGMELLPVTGGAEKRAQKRKRKIITKSQDPKTETKHSVSKLRSKPVRSSKSKGLKTADSAKHNHSDQQHHGQGTSSKSFVTEKAQAPCSSRGDGRGRKRKAGDQQPIQQENERPEVRDFETESSNIEKKKKPEMRDQKKLSETKETEDEHLNEQQNERPDVPKSNTESSRPALARRNRRKPDPIKCDACDKEFRWVVAYCEHILTEHIGGSYCCNRCDNVLSSQDEFWCHNKRHHNGLSKLKCTRPGCTEVYEHWLRLLAHWLVAHNDGQPVKCVVNADGKLCGKLFTDSKSYVHHIQLLHVKQ